MNTPCIVSRLVVLLSPPLQSIGAMKPIQEPNRAKVQVKFLMVQIMKSSLAGKEIIPAMDGGGINQLIRHIQPKCDDMALQQLRRNSNRQDVCENLLDRMGVLGRQGNGRSEPVMAFMDARIEHRLMEKSMAIVEEDFTHEDRKEKIPDDDLRGWQGGIHAVGDGEDLEFVNCRELDDVQDAGDDLVSEDVEETVSDFGGRGLFGGWLDFVSLREGRGPFVQVDI